MQGGKGKRDDDDSAPVSLSIPVDATKLLYPGTLAIHGHYPVANDEPLNETSGAQTPKARRKGVYWKVII